MTSTSQNSWNTKVLLEKTSVNFKLDTGAEVMAITEETFKLLGGITLIQVTSWSSKTKPQCTWPVYRSTLLQREVI